MDSIFEFLEGAEHAVLEALFGEFCKERLDGVEPGGITVLALPVARVISAVP